MEFKPQAPEPSIEQSLELRELITGEPDAFFILTGAWKWNKVTEQYENGSFQDRDENSGLPTGGKDRVLAAAELHKEFPDATIVPMSKTRQDNVPTYAAVAMRELTEKGVNPEKILLEENSVNTITEYKEAARFVKQHRWSNIVFISSNWHLPRCKALLNHIEDFADSDEENVLLTEFAELVRSGKVTTQFIGSTEVLTHRSPHYKALFDKVEEDEGVKERVELEKAALKQIGEGTYGGLTLTKKIFLDQV